MSRLFKIKFGLSPSKIRFFICFNESPIKMMENVFHFILKAFFRSQDIPFFVLTFWPFRKDGLIRKVRLISNFMTFSLVNKHLQYKNYAISHEVKATRQ